MPKKQDLLTCFAELEDPRVAGRCDHKLLDIVAIAVCAVICGVTEWKHIELFGRAKLKWFKTWLELASGIPSHDTFGRVFALLDPDAFEECLGTWVNSVVDMTGGEIISLDGKTARRSHDRRNGKAPIHVVSAWAYRNGIVLGQVKTDEKSNEITAIPDLLDKLDISGCIVTTDAMGCQKEIAGKVIEDGGDYIFGLKGNQRGLREEAEEAFAGGDEEHPGEGRHAHLRTVDKGHGRLEVRDIWMTEASGATDRNPEWKGLRSFGKITSARTVEGKTSTETRYFITSLPCKVKAFARAARAHWGVENSLHWSLDVTFREDDSRIRIGHAAENMAVLRRLVLSALKTIDRKSVV